MRRRKQRGQSVIEFALAAPVLIFMMLAGFSVTVMVSDKVIAGYACRQGARLASEIGGQQTNPNLTTAQVDADIVKNVLAVARAMNYSSLTEIDIYAPTRADGEYQAGDLLDRFHGDGTAWGSGTFTLAQRKQIPPQETSLGVRLLWQYNPPTGLAAFNVNLSEYAVMKESPVLL
jgi:hypothetical protein